jgi:Helix-turn-helix domain
MDKSRTSTVEESEPGSILTLLDERIRRVAEEVFHSMSSANDVRCVKVKAATEILDMSEFRVRQLIKEGKLKVVRPTPHTIRIPLSEIRRFQEDGKQ